MSHLPEGTSELIARALAEDIGAGDVTASATVPAGLSAQANIVLKAPGVIYGLGVVEEVFRQVGVTEVDRTVVEGHWHDSVPRDVALVNGPARAILAGERVALNFLGHLSGIATLTARYVDAVGGTGTRILDTRKTTPGLRSLEKQAVSWGGGINHRFGLFDAVLIKEKQSKPADANRLTCTSRSKPRPWIRSPKRSRSGRTASCSTTWTSSI